MLDFPSEKHVVLLDAVIWREHLRPFLFHVYTPLFYLFPVTAAVHSPLLLQTTCFKLLPGFFSAAFHQPIFPSPPPLILTSLICWLFSPPCLFYFFPPVHPSAPCLPGFLRLSPSSRGDGEEKKIAAQRWLSRANDTRREQTRAYHKQSEKRTNRCRIQTLPFNKHFRDGVASSRLSQSLKGRGGPSRGRPCANEEVGKAAEGGGRESDQMTP